MQAPEVFFAMPLMARQTADDWSRVVLYLEATLGSIYRQTDPHFRIVVACHDVPRLSIPVDDRLEFLQVEHQAPLGGEGAHADVQKEAIPLPAPDT